MADKFLFSMKVFTLGFSVVMIVLFALYALTNLFNRLTSPAVNKQEESAPRQSAGGGPSPQLAAAIAAAINYHRNACFESIAPPVRPIKLPEVEGSRWQAAGREELAGKSNMVDLLRRKKT